MTTTAAVFISLAVLMSALDWIAVARDNVVLEYLSKPAATVAFLATAATLDVPHDATWIWRLVALGFCVAGDVFLMLPRDAFVPGLASFAVAQVMFGVSFLSGEIETTRLLVAAVVATVLAVLLARRFVVAIRRAGRTELVVPVVVYVVVITAMAVTSDAAGTVVAVAGAVVFMLSDSLIAESRFVRARPWHPVGIMVTYHVALAGLVLGLL